MNSVITVLLPCYNGASFLVPAIESVLNQTLAEFELLIIDDGSKDDTWQIIQSYRDPRIRAVHQENRGLAATLNRGINEASCALIARHDQDDLMHPDRLAKQLDFFNGHDGYALVGTWAHIIENDCPTLRMHRHPLSDHALKLMLLFDNPFVHSSVMLSRDAVLDVGGYSEDRTRQPPEDYELWSRLGRRYKLANMGEDLTGYRELAGSMSRSGDSPFLKNVLTISTENLISILQPEVDKLTCRALSALFHGVSLPGIPKLRRASATALLERAALRIQGSGAEPELERICQNLHAHLSSRAIRRNFPLPLLRLARVLSQGVTSIIR